MPELPYSAMATHSPSSPTSQSPRPAMSCTAADFTVMGRISSNSLVGRTQSLKASGSHSPRESPTMSSLVRLLQHKHKPKSAHDNAPPRNVFDDPPTGPDSPALEEEETPQSTIGSLAPDLHPVSRLEDIIESGRGFSNLTDPVTIRQVCLAKVPGWRTGVRIDQVYVSQIMAGLTNQLFRVEVDSALKDRVTPTVVLFRVYGTTVGDLYDSAFELQVFKVLSQNDSAPKLIADFPGGRIEEYILGPALLVQDMCKPPVFCAIATILGRFHRLDHAVPEIASWRQEEASCWRALRRWAKKAWSLYELAKLTTSEDIDRFEINRQPSSESVASTEEVMRDKAKRMNSLARRSFLERLEATGIVEMMQEAHNLRTTVLSGAPRSPVLDIGFCHNDVQENNILVTGTRLRLIDFEYADFNHLAYDIANFLCETTMDYCVQEFPFFDHKVCVEAFPSEELIRMFASVYLSEYTGEAVLPSNEDWIQPFLTVVYRFVLVSHLLWGFWSLIRAPQAATACDFDFLLYAKSRFQAYRIWKSHLLRAGYLPSPL
eukprot:Gregarina_sp_Pseudo_9__5983@NODE_983_length_2004_cov_170_218830_g921_i0_p1_GENE_NODE_983_length_2004_cov_170_218830_g921_i0NODE_983_length_2004_cov_170_218830_g921_i0_p1_ORF_typecomplete_len546_score50_69Choline_kinase/PF01633_20/1_9e44APH/PF01636_23/4_3e15WaaY/PF06176_11/2_9e05EcKinase/PF02958_20/2_6e05Kdo/PF06293_14/1_4e02Kdo/PF06293_14/0_0057Pkinase_fungal/PF17667_1/0_004RIO1/PF01163_22/0_0047DUF1679/PF07914_11/0_022Pkinase/PF00069_25/0_11_NODE_983_length_2004_cov_170_218830_g921_i02231860